MKTEHEIYPYRTLFHFSTVSILESGILHHTLSLFSPGLRTLYPVLRLTWSRNRRAKLSFLLHNKSTFLRRSSHLRARIFNGSATCALNESANMPRSRLRFSVSSRIVVHVVRDADSNDPGVMAGVSPTDKDADFFAFFSKYFFDSALL